MAGTPALMEDDYEFLLAFLPLGWEEKARELGALRRCRKVPDARVLLRLLLIHLAEGCSLRETAARAKYGGLLAVSDVTIMDRLRRSGEWFRWMSSELMSHWVARSPRGVFEGRWQVRVVDGTHVTEPGPTGSSWRLHYAVDLPSLCCSEVHLTDTHGADTAETFGRFQVKPGDLFLGDRAYGLAGSLAHVAAGGGDSLTRFGWRSLPLWSGPTEPFDLFAHLRTLRGVAVGDWPVFVQHEERRLPGRVCAVKRSRQAAEKAQRQARRCAQKRSRQVQPETLEAAAYVFVFTTVPATLLSATRTLEFYRGRWQVELVFKRLKSILGLGHLRKTDEQAARSWLHGKLFVAFLLEVLREHGETFSPWGYPRCPTPPAQPVPMAGGSHAAARAAANGYPASGPPRMLGQLDCDRLGPA